MHALAGDRLLRLLSTIFVITACTAQIPTEIQTETSAPPRQAFQIQPLRTPFYMTSSSTTLHRPPL